MRNLVGAFLVALAACGSTEDSAVSSGAVSCDSVQQPTTYDCPLIRACPDVVYTAGNMGTTGGGSPPDAIDVAAARCTLTAMRDGTPGYLMLRAVIDRGDNDFAVAWWIQKDGTAVVRYAQFGFRYTHAKLQPRSYFDSCLASSDATELKACLRGSWAKDACYPDYPCGT